MPPEGWLSGSPLDWLRYAHSDLELALVGRSPHVLLEELCFHAHQAAEKAIKAVLVAKGISFPKTHNIRILLDLLPRDLILPPEGEDAVSLTDYAVTCRYPADVEPVDEQEYQEAMRLAAAIVQWAEKVIQNRSESFH
jgi:HEPN domain-containing protein